MFGLLRPCAHRAEEYGIDRSEFYAQMCGLCLGLRDEHGQLARMATNTDAMVLTILTEVQGGDAPARASAGPCAARGLRGARVAASPGVTLAATASLLLGAARIRDHVEDGDSAALLRRPMSAMSGRWARQAGAQAALIDFDVEPLVRALAGQGELERAATAHTRLDDLTAPTALCTGEFFAHTAVLAGNPDAVDELREAGGYFGRIAHLTDALSDIEDDLEHRRFNPLTVTRTDPRTAYELVRESDARMRSALAGAGLASEPLVGWALLDPLSGLLRRMGRALDGADAVPLTAAHPHQPPRKPGLLEGIGLAIAQYPTGYACFAEHTRPCSGRRKKSWLRRNACDCGCDCCCDC